MERMIEKAFTDQGRKPIKKELKQFVIVTREEWGAQPPLRDVPVFQYKPNYITFTFNTRSPQCHSREECIQVVQGIQQTDVAGGQPDIDYNFLVGGDGNVYEGRGWTKRVSYSRKNPPTEHPLQSFDIGIIGDYTATAWEYELVTNAMDLVEYGVKNKHILPTYKYVN